MLATTSMLWQRLDSGLAAVRRLSSLALLDIFRHEALLDRVLRHPSVRLSRSGEPHHVFDLFAVLTRIHDALDGLHAAWHRALAPRSVQAKATLRAGFLRQGLQ